MNAMQQETRKPGGYLFEDQGELPEYKPTTDADIRKAAHIVNGGEATFPCPKCKGRGTVTIGYRNPYAANCFKCKGSGNVSKGVVAAAKGKQTKAMNAEKFRDDHAAELAYMHKRIEKGSNYYYGFKVRLEAHGTLNDGVIDIIRKDMAKDAEFFAKKNAERAAAAAPVNMSAIEKMFAIASENKKNPKFYAGDMIIYPAKASGANPGAIYVKVKGEYAGKIASGRFFATAAAPAGIVEKIDELAADPRAAAAKWGKAEVRCCFCGIELTDPVSRENGYGPICAGNWLGG